MCGNVLVVVRMDVYECFVIVYYIDMSLKLNPCMCDCVSVCVYVCIYMCVCLYIYVGMTSCEPTFIGDLLRVDILKAHFIIDSVISTNFAVYSWHSVFCMGVHSNCPVQYDMQNGFLNR